MARRVIALVDLTVEFLELWSSLWEECGRVEAGPRKVLKCEQSLIGCFDEFLE